MITGNKDLSRVLTAEHEDKWVAVTPDRKKVVAFSDCLDELVNLVNGKKVVYLRGLKKGSVYAF